MIRLMAKESSLRLMVISIKAAELMINVWENGKQHGV